MAFDPVPYREQIVGPDGKLTRSGIVWFRWLDKLRSASVASADLDILLAAGDGEGMGGTEASLADLDRQAAVQTDCRDYSGELDELERRTFASPDSGRDWSKELEEIRRELATLDSVTGSTGGLEALTARLDVLVAAVEQTANSRVEINALGTLLASFDQHREIDWPYWDDLRTPLSSLGPGATPADPIVYGPSGAVRILGFDGHSQTEDMDFSVQLPHSYLPGSDIYPHVHWCPTTADAGNVIWDLDYYWVNIGGTIPGIQTLHTAATAAGGTAWKHFMTDFSAPIAGAGFERSSMLICRIYRTFDAVGDDYDHDAGLFEIDFHFKMNALGTVTEKI